MKSPGNREASDQQKDAMPYASDIKVKPAYKNQVQINLHVRHTQPSFKNKQKGDRNSTC